MTDSTPLIHVPPEQESAGVPRRDGTAARAPPVRLQLEVDELFLQLIRSMRSLLSGAPPAEKEDRRPEPRKKKGLRKLRKVSLRSLQLGQRKIVRTDEVDAVAKFLYSDPQKIVCQLRRGDALARIDILCSKIKVMAACFDDPTFDTLRIEVKSSSEQYRASLPQGRIQVHRQWQRGTDITTRTFCLEFDKGTLEIVYGKMLYTVPSLMPLTLPPPPPPPPGGNKADEGSQSSAGTQQSGTYTAVDDVEADKLSSTNTGANVVTHDYSGTRMNDTSLPPHMGPFFVEYAEPSPIDNVPCLHSLYT